MSLLEQCPSHPLGEILSLFYETLYLWTEAYVSPLLISYSDVLVCFVLSS